MSRLSSQGTVISIQSKTPVTTAPITAATKAKPAVLTATGTHVVGDIVVPRKTGFSSLDDRPFSIPAVSAGTVTLADSDTTTETATLGLAATLESPTLIELCRSTFSLNNPAGATIDVTTLCDDAHKIVSGLPAIGTWAANGFYDKDDAAMWAARDYYRSGQIVTFKVMFNDGSGACFAASVNLFDVTAGINAAVTNNLGGNVSGLVSAISGSGAGAMMAESDSKDGPREPALAA